MTVSEWLQWGTQQLQAVDTPAAEARLLLAHCLQQNSAWLLTHDTDEPATERSAHYAHLIHRRAHGEPAAYLLGQREFWSLSFTVNPAVLIPRPETELLVELALQRIPTDDGCTVVDLGTGSGAIACALAKERPRATIHATDRSAAALALAQHNALQLGFHQLQFHRGDWLTALPTHLRFDVLVSNPPYIAEHDPHLATLTHEPKDALTAGTDGLDAFRTLIRQAPNRLKPGGCLLVEHGFDQAEKVQALFHERGFSQVETWRDLGNQPRVSGGVW